MKKLYYLGPSGTYSEMAASKIKNKLNLEVELTAISTINKIVDLLNNSDDVGIIPIENSIEGIVRPTIDSLYLTDVKINAQTEIEINQCLISKGNMKDIKHIISHPQALAQCQKYILDNFDNNIDLISSTSTAQAVKDLINKDNTYSAIASINAVCSEELKVLDKNIADVKDNKTRFVLVSKNKINISKETRTSIVFNTKNESGALLKILNIFYKHKLNLVYLESRPSKVAFGEYNFFSDIDKGLEEIKPALLEIEQECNFYKLLGSYPNV